MQSNLTFFEDKNIRSAYDSARKNSFFRNGLKLTAADGKQRTTDVAQAGA